MKMYSPFHHESRMDFSLATLGGVSICAQAGDSNHTGLTKGKRNARARDKQRTTIREGEQYLEVVDLGLRVDPEDGLELADRTTVDLDGDGGAGSGAGDVDGEGLLASKAQF